MKSVSENLKSQNSLRNLNCYKMLPWWSPSSIASVNIFHNYTCASTAPCTRWSVRSTYARPICSFSTNLKTNRALTSRMMRKTDHLLYIKVFSQKKKPTLICRPRNNDSSRARAVCTASLSANSM